MMHCADRVLQSAFNVHHKQAKKLVRLFVFLPNHVSSEIASSRKSVVVTHETYITPL